jgi:hypothetical protein
MVWGGECRFMSCQLGPDTDRYSHPNVRGAERKDWGGREKLADPQTSAWGVRRPRPEMVTLWELTGSLRTTSCGIPRYALRGVSI